MNDDTAGAAKRHLHQCLRWARNEVIPKLDDLDEYDVRRPMTRTGVNLLGLVKHLAFYEASYFGFVFDRPYPEALPAVDQDFRNPDLMWVPVDETRVQVIEAYHRACGHADETIEALPLDAVGHVPWWGTDDVPLFNVLGPGRPCRSRRTPGGRRRAMDRFRLDLEATGPLRSLTRRPSGPG